MPMATSSARAAESYEGPCVDNVGVTVVVDFQELGGGVNGEVNVRCAPGPVTTGLDALDKAGILWEGTRQFPGFVCRIAGQPGPDREACAVTPPATAYWTYWAAQRGGDWCYSSVGAAGRKPPPGSIEGWSFALDKVAVDVPPPEHRTSSPEQLAIFRERVLSVTYSPVADEKIFSTDVGGNERAQRFLPSGDGR